MEPSFLQAAGTSDFAARRRARRRYQVLAGVVVMALLAVGLWAVLRHNKPPPLPLANQSGGGGRPAGSARTSGGPGGGPTTRPGPAPMQAVDLSPAELAAQGRVPAPAGPANAEQLKDLAAKLAQAENLLAAKNLVPARAMFNEAVDRGLAAEANDRCVGRLALLADQTLFNQIALPGDPVTDLYKVPPGGAAERIGRMYKVRSELLLKINGIADARKLRADQTIKVIRGPFNAVVDKSDYTLSVYLDQPGGEPAGPPARQLLVRRFRVGLGEHSSTPTGVWKVAKMEEDKPWRNPRTGQWVQPADPKYPLGKPGRWIGLEGVAGPAVGQNGYGIHGTNEPDSIGKQVSLGCVRMLDANVAEVWGLLRIADSRVTIRD